MLFDVKAALAEIRAASPAEERGQALPSSGPARPARQSGGVANVAKVADVAGGHRRARSAPANLHPDAAALLDLLLHAGPATYGAAARTLGWGATRAWQAEARLRAAGLVRLGEHGKAAPLDEAPAR